MSNNDFFARITNIRNPEIEKGINSGDPYIICDLLEKTKGGLNNIYLRDLENAIIKTNDIVQIYEFLFLAVDMNINGFDRERFEAIIRQSGNAKLMCYCMEFVPGTNIELMLKSLENTRNAKCMEMLINNEEYKDVFEIVKQINPTYEDTVEKAKSFDYYPESLKEFIDSRNDISTLKRRVICTKNPHLITELANYIEYLNEYKNQSYDINDLLLAQEQIGDPMQSYEFLSSVNVENKNGLIQAVINSKKVKFMYYIYEYVPGLTEEEKSLLKSCIESSSNKKYKDAIKENAQLDKEYGN